MEISRQNLSSHCEFEPFKAFSLIDASGNGKIDSYEIVDFLKKHFVSADLEDARAIIREYDASNDGTL